MRYAYFYAEDIVNGRGIPSIECHSFESGIRISGLYPCESVA